MATTNRRQFLSTMAATATLPTTAVLPGIPRERSNEANDETVAFFLVGDTHFLAQADDTAKLDARSQSVTSQLVDTLNRLPGAAIPELSGGGVVKAASGVIHAGDCIDTGDKANVKMQATEWSAFVDTFGLSGQDGRLKLPIYEVHGNHDSPQGDGLAVKGMIERNKHRTGVNNVSNSGVHYSWDWGPVHCVNLGIVVGQVSSTPRRRRYAPLDSLQFLIDDLKAHVGSSGRPVVITHHVDVLRYAQALPVDDSKAMTMEWDPEDVSGFHAALKGYNVAAILYGHTHVRNVFRWNGSNKPTDQGIPTFNVDNSSHFSGPKQALFYFEIEGSQITAREYQTHDSWESGFWTPEKWTYNFG